VAPAEWTYPSATVILLPHNLSGVLFQAVLAMTLMVGFESSTALAASANNAQRDIPRGTVLALIIQGAFAYLVGYFAAGLALNSSVNAAASRVPIGDLSLQIGDLLLKGNGGTLMLFIGFLVLLAILGGALTSMNNGVRISFAMALDTEMPDVLGFLHPQYATPYNAVILLSVVSAIIGAAGVIGGLPVLMGILLASNIGAFLLYALLCILTVVTFVRDSSFNVLRHIIFPVLGLAANVGIIIGALGVGLRYGGVITQATLIALGVAIVWLIVSIAYYFVKRRV